MKKIIFGLIIIFFSFTFYTSQIKGQTINPSSVIKIKEDYKPKLIIGGQINNLIARQVENAESAGFDCKVPGSSLNINLRHPRAQKGDYDFIVMEGAEKWTKNNHLGSSNQWIIALVRGTTTITCEKCEKKEESTLGVDALNEDENQCEQLVFELPTIIKYGTSR